MASSNMALLVCAVLALSSAASASRMLVQPTESTAFITSALATPEALFEKFIADHGKAYEAEEKASRFETFKFNLKKIEDLNAIHTEKVFGINKFADMTEDEFKQEKMCSHDMSEGKLATTSFAPTLTSVPDSKDWTTEGAVTPIKDQGQCGSCWTFGTTGVVEGAWYLAKGELLSLSEQMLVDCVTADDACNGGLQSDALDFIIKEGGIVSETMYPYTSGGGSSGSCKSSLLKSSNYVATVKSWSQVESNADALKAAVAEGPVTVALNAGTTSFQLYTGGVMDPWSFLCNPYSLDHAVLIVGYGTDASSGKDYWKVKNSWGTSWGEEGYFRIKRGSNTCGIESDAQAVTSV